MDDDYRFTCGCAGEVPAYMGRGKARKERIYNYFNRPCVDCRKKSLRKRAASLCVLLPGNNSDGKRNFRYYTEEEIENYVRKYQ